MSVSIALLPVALAMRIVMGKDRFGEPGQIATGGRANLLHPRTRSFDCCEEGRL